MKNRTFGTDNQVALKAEVFSFDAFKSSFCSHKNVSVNGTTELKTEHFRVDKQTFQFLNGHFAPDECG
jgi:hypothetical protein